MGSCVSLFLCIWICALDNGNAITSFQEKEANQERTPSLMTWPNIVAQIIKSLSNVDFTFYLSISNELTKILRLLTVSPENCLLHNAEGFSTSLFVLVCSVKETNLREMLLPILLWWKMLWSTAGQRIFGEVNMGILGISKMLVKKCLDSFCVDFQGLRQNEPIEQGRVPKIFLDRVIQCPFNA